MNKSKLLFITLLAFFCLFNTNLCHAYSRIAMPKRALEDAIKIGPEYMMKFAFEDKEYLGSCDYRNQQQVSNVQRHFVDLYPDRPDLYKRAACALGKCLKESKQYTDREVERVVWYITTLTDRYYGKK